VSQFEVGDFVRILDNAAAARELQQGRTAEWTDSVKAVRIKHFLF